MYYSCKKNNDKEIKFQEQTFDGFDLKYKKSIAGKKFYGK